MTYNVYQTLISNGLEERGAAYEPRHVEAVMRNHYDTLDHLSPAAFDAAIDEAIEVLDILGFHQAEELARTFGL